MPIYGHNATINNEQIRSDATRAHVKLCTLLLLRRITFILIYDLQLYALRNSGYEVLGPMLKVFLAIGLENNPLH